MSEIRLGDTNINSMPYRQLTLQRIAHEGYNPQTFENDVALFRIPAVPESLGLSLVQLAPPDIGSLANESVRASGFGFTTNQGPISLDLLKVNLRALSNEECRARFPSQLPLFDTTLCAYWLTREGEAVCSGDSGGPLVYENNGQSVQVGLVSFGLASGCTNGPQAFARVSEYRDWIDRTMAANAN